MKQMIYLALLLTFVSGEKFCDICQCTKMISCSEENITSEFPGFQLTDYQVVTDISISNQPRLAKLNDTSLRPYTNLQTLSITKSGLNSISLDAFKSNRLLEKIDFEDNQIAVLPWKLFDGLPNTKLFIGGNPLQCTCANKWLQLSTMNNSIVNFPKWPMIILPVAKLLCRDEFGQNNSLLHYSFNKCEFPIVRLNPEQVELIEGTPFTAQCTSEEKSDLVKWNIDPLRSVLKVINFQYGQVLNVSNVRREDMGDIICIVENQVGRAAKALRLKVRFASQIVNLTFIENFNRVTYITTGYPVPTLSWRLNGSTFSTRSLWHYHEITGPYTGTLHIDFPSLNDEGDYMLIASNEHGTTNRTIEVDFKRELPDGIFENSAFPEFMPFIPPPNMSVGPNKVAIIPMMDNPNNPSNGTQIPFIPWIGNLNNHSIGKQNEDVGFKMEVIALTIALITTCIIACTFGALYLYKRNRSDGVLRNLTTQIENQLHPLRTDRPYVSSGGIELTPMRITRDFLAMNDNILYEETCGQPEDGSISVQSEGAIIPLEYKTILSTLLRPIKDLGQGAFGKVYLASLGLVDSGDEVLVAVKVLKSTSKGVRREFDREAKLLTSLTHDNIIQFYGACIDSEPLKMVFEYMIKGDLNQFLRTKGPDANMLKTREKTNYVLVEDLTACEGDSSETLSILQLLKIAKNISAGMAYLNLKNCVHRDLATRNCLVGEDLVVKIGDFGMSRKIYTADYYRMGASQALLPVRWMSPESITYRKFSPESDVWSFGIVLWEIMTFGKQPWYEYSNVEAIVQITSGHLLGQPPDCPPHFYDLMLSCWAKEPQDRITMKDIDQRLQELLLEQPSTCSE